MNVPLLDLKSEYRFLKREIDKQIEDCLNSQHWILGEKVKEFEKAVARYLGVKFAIGVASGTDALVLSLQALALKRKGMNSFGRKDEIITTAFTFVATAEAILRSGATPVFVDIDPRTFNISVSAIKKAVNKNTVGIVPVHLYGLGSDMGEISKIARDNNLFVLEDNAQSFGAAYKGKKLGTLGDLGAFSFFPSKNLGCFGDGGLIATNNRPLAKLLGALRNHGQIEKYDALYPGYNSRLDSLQAAILLAKLKYIDKFNNSRQAVAAAYDKAFENIKEINAPYLPADNTHVYNLYTIEVLEKRDKLLKYLNSKDIGARIYYPLALYQMKAFKEAKLKSPFPGTEEALSRVVSLPAHPFLKKPQIDYIITAIRNFFNR